MLVYTCVDGPDIHKKEITVEVTDVAAGIIYSFRFTVWEFSRKMIIYT